MPKVAVLTARFGLRDRVAAPFRDAAASVCISDLPADVAPGWSFRLQPGDQREARRIKLHPWEFFPDGFDWYLWIDSNMTPRHETLAPILAPISTGASIYVSPHPHRNCVRQEFEACVRLRKDDPKIMQPQLDRYIAEGMPEKLGMVETGLLLLKNDQLARTFCKLWYDEIKYGSVRDQLAFPYIAWKNQLPYGLFPRPARDLYVAVTKHQPSPRPA